MIKECAIYGLWHDVTIFEGVKANGEIFILPLTKPRLFHEERYDSLKLAIPHARRKWIKLISDYDLDSWVLSPHGIKRLDTAEPIYFDGSFSELVAIAFAHRIVNTREQAITLFGSGCPQEDE
ncbi:MAG: hypothetical protein Q7U12_00615 [Undibacterium sp.]|nr:hypothetical protein [Undibacterium sp.]